MQKINYNTLVSSTNYFNVLMHVVRNNIIADNEHFDKHARKHARKVLHMLGYVASNDLLEDVVNDYAYYNAQ